MRRVLSVFAGVVALTVAARADLPSPRLDRISPLGGSAGTTVEVQAQGNDLEEPRTLVFDHPGITAKPVEGKDKRYAVIIAADVPEGTYDVRLVGKWGVSSPRLFAVSHGIVDIEEKEPNNDGATAQQLNVNCALNGQSDG